MVFIDCLDKWDFGSLGASVGGRRDGECSGSGAGEVIVGVAPFLGKVPPLNGGAGMAMDVVGSLRVSQDFIVR